MKSDPGLDLLVADLRALGRSVPDPAPDRLTTAIMADLAAVSTPRPVSRTRQALNRVSHVLRQQRRRLLLATAVLLLGGLGVPGVRAEVAEWFGFDGVSVWITPAPGPTRAPPPPTASAGASLEQARSRVAFRPVELPALGPAHGVEVSPDRRLLSLTWTGPDGNVTRLDQFDGRLDYLFAKTAPGAEWLQVGEESALWFEKPHEVVILDEAGNRRTETARTAGHTLIWAHDGTVLRLETEALRAEALRIAGTARSLP
jgi:hypothetical protein